jgi:hypothetical protein
MSRGRYAFISTLYNALANVVLFRQSGLMAGLPGLRAGNASAVLRTALIARLEETASGGLFQWEVNRRSRVVEELDRTRRQLAGRRVRIPTAADVEERRMRDLSGDIALKPGLLRIEFYGAEDLAAKLLELSKAMANDWPAFTRAVEDGGKEAAAAVR